MSRRRPHRRCKGCDRLREEVGPLSATGLCASCSSARLLENVEGLRTHSGPAFQRWRRGMAASVGAVLLDAGRDEA